MSFAATSGSLLLGGQAVADDTEHRALVEELRRNFSIDFAVWDGESGEMLQPGQRVPNLQTMAADELVRAVARDRKTQFIADENGILALAVPIHVAMERCVVATGIFATSEAAQRVHSLAVLFDGDCAAATKWLDSQRIWDAELLLQLAEAIGSKLNAEADVERMKKEVDLISQNLATTYEEISLLYTITQNLRISRSDEELGQLAIEWLVDCVSASSFAIQYLPVAEQGDSTYKARTRPNLIVSGDCPVDEDGFRALIEELDLTAAMGAFIANEKSTTERNLVERGIRQLIIVPLSEGDNVFGWLAAFNHVEDREFGTIEANLLSSVGALLGIHSGNRDLYRQQSELLANIVRALVSAIDAKDPYTSGHSDRVARYAVRIALEMRVNPKLLNTIYMSGLLHDVGKIGIDDNVLRKAGRLTDAEFEHIKKHPELGHKILADIKQLADVLPAVLHHHEQWDGKGYPMGLAGENIPQLARIMSVADAYDAMTSDRPYRAGMPDEKVDGIFKNGSGEYWDPEVVDAYFKAKEDIEDIRWRERPELDLDEQSWA
ncbi:MAG: HD-GYP domain-containing protein [Planctomycetaceae bacterium]|nr:HD-GYP domain-containing protein [Planctomycetales bacterium]MCB9923475.1 HD-GYP domain-containing protein [Planctomycetaceae bacterium]